MNPNSQKELKLQDVVEIGGERYLISTIKMEVRHSWINQNDHVNVYETMVFEKEKGQVKYNYTIYNTRYTTYDNAVEGHNHILKNAEKIIKACKEHRAKIG